LIKETEVMPLLETATGLLSGCTIDTARLDSEILLAHILKCETPQLFTYTAMVNEAELLAFNTLIARRMMLEPIAYLTGNQPFWTLDFKVNEHVLIPRPDTETLVETVLARSKGQANPYILDLGTGSGCIVLSLLSELADAVGVGIDVSIDALNVAVENSVLNNLQSRVSFVESNWFDTVGMPESGFSVIVSNPPYVRSDEMPTLMVDVRDFEPAGALDGGPDGLIPYRHIIDQAGGFLRPDGLLAVELGIGQADDVAALFEEAGFEEVQKTADLAGVERVVSGKKAKM